VRGEATGADFFWLLFFAQAKKSNLPWVSHPQVCIAVGDTNEKPSKGRLCYSRPGFRLSPE
jgi:hypothetical protein